MSKKRIDAKAKGTRHERELKKQFEEDGLYVMRSAGSRGPFDLAVFDLEYVRLIQVKTLGEDVDREKLKNVEVPPNCIKEIWVRIPRRGFQHEVLE